MRREMEDRNEREKEKLMQELEKLRLSSPVEITVSADGGGTPLGSPVAENDPYEVMKSIASQPSRQRGTSIRIKDITGGREHVSCNSESASNLPVPVLNFSSSPSNQSPLQSPELSLLSPATGQHNSVPTPVSESPVDSEMMKLLGTYDIVDPSTVYPVTHTDPVDMPDGIPEYTASSVFSGYGRQNPSQNPADNGLSASCPQVSTHLYDNQTVASSDTE